MIKELAKQCRSYRGYDPSRKITEAELKELVDITRYVASSINMQPLKYRIVWKEDEVAEVLANTKWAAGLPELHLPYEGTGPAAFIIICHDYRVHENKNVFLRDIGAAAQTMLLAATEQGLGGCMIGNFNPKKMQEILGIPEEIEPNLVVAFGKPDEEITIVDCEPGEKTAYYRDETGKKHFVPKRKLEDILI